MKEKQDTILSIHSIFNLLGCGRAENTQKALSTTAIRVLFCLLKILTKTNFKGHGKLSASKINPFVKFQPKLLVSRLELLKIMELKTVDNSRFADILTALNRFSSEILSLEYERPKMNKSGEVILNSSGEAQFQVVSTSEPLFTVSRVYSKSDVRKVNFEIIPATIFLDQWSNYSVFFQEHLFEMKVSKIVNYTFLYLLLQTELRKHNRTNPKTINIKWDELACIIRVSQNYIKRKKDWVLEKLGSALEVSKGVQLLESWELSNDYFTINLPRRKPSGSSSRS
jgi:hypothetical protein